MIVVVMGVLLRLLLIPLTADRQPVLDEKQYLSAGPSIAATGVPSYPNPIWDEAHSSPIYPHFIAACYAVFGPDHLHTSVKLIQALLGGLTALFVHWIALSLFDRRTALLSATIAALYPTFLAYSHYFYSETLYTFLLTAVTAALLRESKLAHALALLGTGLLGGLAALTRSIFLLQAPIIAGWIALRDWVPSRRHVLLALIFVAGVATVIVPWSIRNTLRYDRFLLIDTNAGNVLYKNWNGILPENHDIGLIGRWHHLARRYHLDPLMRDRVEEEHIVDRNNAEIRAAIAYVLEHPGIYMRNSILRATETLNPTSFVVRALRLDHYGAVPRQLEELIVLTIVVSTMGLMIFSVLGLSLFPMTRARMLPTLLILSHTGACVLIISTSRYRYPMMPLLIPFAAHAILDIRNLPKLRDARLRWLAAAALIAFMGYAWIAYVPLSFPTK
jgi:4-amino-4-deoxy-L-arabinose transferase-like glycosyltransferase